MPSCPRRVIPHPAFASRLRPCFALLCCLICALWRLPPAMAAAPVRVLVVTSNAHLLPAAEAAFRAMRGNAPATFTFRTDAPDAATLAQADVIYARFAPATVLRAMAPGVRQAAARGALVFGAPAESVDAAWGPGAAKRDASDAAQPYWEAGGVDNLAAFLALAVASRQRMQGLPAQDVIAVPAVRPAPAAGIYHPRAALPFASLQDYLKWYRQAGIVGDGAPLVGIAFYATHYRQRDLAHIDALIAGLEHQGVGAVPVFGWPLSGLDALVTQDGASPLRALLALNLTIPRAEDKDWLARHGLHTINLIATRDSEAGWRADVRGIAGERLPLLLTAPERSGATEPILFATQEGEEGGKASAAVPERVEAIVARVRRWIALQDKPPASKHVAVLYYNNPPGRGNLGASYLATLPSLTQILQRLRAAGYQTGNQSSDDLPDTPTLTALLEANGRNIETWSPGELARMVRGGHVTLLPLAQYRRWFEALPPAFRAAVTRAWGPPERNPLMLARDPQGEPVFVIPGLRFGNVFVGPQPLRSTFARAMDTSHDTITPPPHSYLAAYLWYRHAFGADAVVHVGRHGTLEWLPGKQVGQAGDDSAEVLLGDLPNAYVYIQDGGGEAIQAKRRSAAVLVSHLAPLLASAGQPPVLAQLDEAIEQAEATRDSSPELSAQYRQQAIAQMRALKLDQQLGLDANAPWAQIEPTLHAFLHKVEAEPMPLGIHALGEMPPEADQVDALALLLASQLRNPAHDADVRAWAEDLVAGRVPSLAGIAEDQVPAVRSALGLARQWLADLRASPRAELDGLVTVLAGRYLPTGPLGDPVRTPDGLPTGRNLHAFDGAKIPTPAAWALGKTMAAQTLARYRQETGRLPESVSMVLWYGETERHQGAMEAEALWLMGVAPVWNARGGVEDVRLIPDAELGRPRVNVLLTISGIYRDGFGDKVALLDKAARLAAAAGDNAISRHDRTVAAALAARGTDSDTAGKLARARVFAAKPGNYAIGVQQMVEQSRDAQDGPDALARQYLRYMNFAYSAEGWGASAPDALASHLASNEAVLFSRTSTLYGALDNDDTYQYAGGLTAATRAVRGRAPRLWLHNLRRAGETDTVDARTWLATELNARQWNPKWIGAMQRSGYAGAREMFKEIEHLYGFQATVPEQMPGEFWQRTYDVYVADKLGLGMDAFFRQANPHAQQGILARLLEVDRQGSYRFTDAERAELLRRYADAVRRDGLSCTANTCGNPVLMAHIAQAGRAARVDPALLRALGRQLADAVVAPGPVARPSMTARAVPAPVPQAAVPANAPQPVTGQHLVPRAEPAAPLSPARSHHGLIALALAVLAIALGALREWRRARRVALPAVDGQPPHISLS
ncbi:cobaltochelatase subunit CobN [Cupriavidus sp. 2KB_3]|uniref:cobaltochelatase subunit CobN n=1 Tax=Cupriavidus TaxID=106589 RepID=UPI0016568630|nr:cobaltochelatase subunit CobN [Cupriavidus campinensis]